MPKNCDKGTFLDQVIMIFSAPAGKGREDKLVFYAICRKLRRRKVIVLPASVISRGIFNIKRESVTTAGKKNPFTLAKLPQFAFCNISIDNSSEM